jgi:hypothetical protein
MGFRLSFIATKGMNRADALAALNLYDTGEAVSLETMSWVCADLPDQWFLVLTDTFDFPTPERMAAVSVGGAAIACSVDEHVMYSVARGYREGLAVWSIDHDGGEKGVRHLDVAGDPPPEWPAVRERLSKEQDNEGGEDALVDWLFDAPAELAYALCGYRYDEEDVKGQTIAFTRVAEERRPGRGGFLGRLFGRG